MRKKIKQLDNMSIAFGVSAAITLILNTILAIIKDIYPPLQKMMASLSGHHWITHAVFDIVAFYLLGYLFFSMKIAQNMDANKLISLLYSSTIIAVVVLAGWFFFS
jgi:hypothetical protein